MPYILRIEETYIQIDNRVIQTSSIRDSLLPPGQLENAVILALRTGEVIDELQDLYIHIFSRDPVDISIQMARHGHYIPDDWWVREEP